MTQDRTDWSDLPAAGGPGDDDVAPEAIVIEAEIEETRGEMTQTVDAIGAKLAPANIVQSAKETVRDATVGKVEQMANSAGQMVEEAGATAQQTGAGIVDTIRRNPIPAAMVGLGLGMLWRQRSTMSSGGSWSRGSLSNYGSSYGSGYGTGYGAAGYTSTYARTTGYGAADTGTPLPERVGQTAGEAVDNVRQVADQAATNVTQTAGHAVQTVQQTGGQMADQMGRMVQENPLAAGVVALAVGTALAMALPTTQMERRTLGQAGERLIDQAGSAIEKPLQEAEEKARQA